VRTTIDIPDVLYRRLKSTAATQGRSVKSLIVEATERAWGEQPLLRPSDYIKLPLIESADPGTLHLTNEMIDALLNDELPDTAPRR
jgi:hypothetical protein